jgi:hypothetical protein
MDYMKKALDHVKRVLEKDAAIFGDDWERISQGLMYKDGKFVDEMVYMNKRTGEEIRAYHDVAYMNEMETENNVQ